MHLIDVYDEENFYLLTNSNDIHRYNSDHSYKHGRVARGSFWLVWVPNSKLNLDKTYWFLQQMCKDLQIIGGFHACRKRERKSGYQRR